MLPRGTLDLGTSSLLMPVARLQLVDARLPLLQETRQLVLVQGARLLVLGSVPIDVRVSNLHPGSLAMPVIGTSCPAISGVGLVIGPSDRSARAIHRVRRDTALGTAKEGAILLWWRHLTRHQRFPRGDQPQIRELRNLGGSIVGRRLLCSTLCRRLQIFKLHGNLTTKMFVWAGEGLWGRAWGQILSDPGEHDKHIYTSAISNSFTHTHKHQHKHTHTHTHTNTHTHTQSYTCSVHVYTRAYVHIYTYTNVTIKRRLFGLPIRHLCWRCPHWCSTRRTPWPRWCHRRVTAHTSR